MNDRDDLINVICQKKDIFTRLHNVTPNVVFLGVEVVHKIFPELSKFKRDSALYIYGMAVYMDYKDPKRISIGYVTNVIGSVYRHESCPKKNKCDDYQGYHCAGCNGVKEY